MSNAYQQLVDDLNSGELGLTQVQNAIREHLRQSENIPEQARDLICGKGPEFPGLVQKHFSLLRETIGCFELAVRRAESK